MKLRRLVFWVSALSLLATGASFGQFNFGPKPTTPDCLSQHNGSSLSHPVAAAQCSGPVNNRTVSFKNQQAGIPARLTVATAAGSEMQKVVAPAQTVSIPVKADDKGMITVEALLPIWTTVCTYPLLDHGPGNISVVVFTKTAAPGADCSISP